MNLDRFVTLAITLATRAVSRRGFGNIMLVGYHNAFLDRVREYTTADDMVTDGLAETHPLTIAARAIEAQSPRVPSWKVGRRSGIPTQIVRLVPLVTTEGTIYSGSVGGQAWTYTVGAASSVAIISTAIAAAINALTVAVTASGASTTHVECTNDAAGTWFAYEFDTETSVDVLTVEDRTVEPATTLATDLAAIKVADPDFYGLAVVDAGSQAQIEAVATWHASQVGIYVAHSMDTEVETSSTADVATALKTALRTRTVLLYSRVNHGTGIAAALLGCLLARSFGTECAFPTWVFKQLLGCSQDSLSDAAITRLIGSPASPTAGKNAMIYAQAVPNGTNSGTPITAGGLTSGGIFVDDQQGADYLSARLQEAAFNLQIARPKVPFTAAGIDTLVGAVRNTLRTLSRAPFAIIDSDFTVEPTELADVSSGDLAARYYNGVRFGASTQGAIHSMTITGTVAP